MAESINIADLFVGLGVKADPAALATLEKFVKVLDKAAKGIEAFAPFATKASDSFATLGASGATLSPLIAQLDALLSRMAALKSTGLKVGTPQQTADSGANAADKAAAQAQKAEDKAAADRDKAAAKQLAEAEKLAAAKKKIADKAAADADKAMDKEVTAELKAAEKELAAQEKAAKAEEKIAEKEAAAWKKAANDAAWAAEKQAQTQENAWKKAASEAEKAAAREAAAMAKVVAAEQKAAEKAAALADAEKKAADEQKAANGIFGANTIESFTGAMGIAIDVVEALAKAAAVAVASVVALGTALAANSLDTAKLALADERAAGAIGFTTEAYQKAAYALQRYGVDAGKLPQVLGQLTDHANVAAGGSKEMGAAFDAIGLSAKAYLELAPEDQLKALADAFNKTTDPTKKMYAATKLLGGEMAKSLLPLLSEGSAGLAAFGDQAEQLGLVLSDSDIEASKKLTSQWAELTGMVDGLRLRLGTALIPVLSDLAENLAKWYDANKDVISQKLEETVAKISDAFVVLGEAGESLNRIFGGPDGFFKSAGKLYDIAAAMLSIGKYVAAFTAALYPVTLLIAAFTAVGLAVQDFYTYLTGGTSIVGTLIDQFGETDTLLGALVRTFQALGNVASAAFNLLSIGFNAAWEAAAPFRDLLSSIAEIAGGVLLAGIQELTSELTTFLNVLTAGLNGVATLLGSAPATIGAQALGATVGTGGAVGAALAPSSSALAATLAPTGPSASRGATTNTITIQGATINGSGLDEAALTRVLAQHTANQARQTQSSLLGLQV